MTRDDLEPALAALDRALGDQPDLVYDDLVEAVRRLIALRNRLIAEQRRGEPIADRLNRLNALLSLIVGAEYPLEGVRRERIETARREAAALLP